MGLKGIVGTKGEWLPYAIDIVLTATALSLAFGGFHVIRLMEYVGGTRHNLGWGLFTGLVMKPLILLIALLVVLNAVVSFLRRSATRKRRVAALLFSAIVVVAACIPLREPGPLAPVFLGGLARRMAKDADIAAIQQWLATEGAEYADREYRYPFPETLPQCLVEFKPMYIRFSAPAAEEGMTVEFRWYTAHGEQHGLVVGPPTMETPERGLIRLPDGWHESRRPMEPGAYVFCRG